MKLNETWVIKHKDTGVIWVASSGKSSWRAKGHAKNAWNCSLKHTRNYLPERFDNQDTYVLVKLLPESEKQLEKAVELLDNSIWFIPRDDPIHKEIEDFLGIFGK